MHKFFKYLQVEVKNLFPVFLYFFILFGTLHLIDVMLRVNVIGRYVSFSIICVDALLVAKVFFITEKLPWFNLFSEKHFLLISFWKTLLYGIITVIVRVLDSLVSLIIAQHSFNSAVDTLFHELFRGRFWLIQLYLLFFVFIFVLHRELKSSRKNRN